MIRRIGLHVLRNQNQRILIQRFLFLWKFIAIVRAIFVVILFLLMLILLGDSQAIQRHDYWSNRGIYISEGQCYKGKQIWNVWLPACAFILMHFMSSFFIFMCMWVLPTNTFQEILNQSGAQYYKGNHDCIVWWPL